MDFWSFAGGFLAVAAGVAVVYFVVRNKLRGFSRRVFGTSDLLKALEDVDSVEAQSPRSLNGCDSLLLPQILRDFPDLDIDLIKTYARDELKKQLGQKPDFMIYNVVISKYLRSTTQKTIVLQAALSHTENSKTNQLRYELQYTYVVDGHTETVAANCPNCGGALGYGVTVCPYCDSRVTNVLGNCWQFTQVDQR